MQSTTIHYGDQSSELFFGATLRAALAELSAAGGQIYILTDTTIDTLYGGDYEGYSTIVIPAGEGYKHWETVEEIINTLQSSGADRSSMLVGVGGGVICDIAGFVAAIYMRGIAFAFVPSTVLAQADAAIGGKNGLNMGLFKNLIGTIRQPEAIFFCPDLLVTLSERDYKAGFAEIIKYGMLFDPAFVQYLAAGVAAFRCRDSQFLSEVIRRAVQYKNDVVVGDPYEKGQRKLLNFGHTIGHAIERLYELPHGFAVGIGMVYACRLSEKQLGFAVRQTEILLQLLGAYDLPTHWAINPQAVVALLAADKKKQAHTIDMILLEAIGKPSICRMSLEEVGEWLVSV